MWAWAVESNQAGHWGKHWLNGNNSDSCFMDLCVCVCVTVLSHVVNVQQLLLSPPCFSRLLPGPLSPSDMISGPLTSCV